MKKIKLTKKQEKYIKEAVNITVNTGSTNGNVQQAVQNAKNDAQRAGINVNKVGFNIPAKESVMYTKKKIEEIKLKNILNKSEMFTKKDLSELLKKKN